eukprot:6191056-Pleurochrysis_carterae.AAC.2
MKVTNRQLRFLIRDARSAAGDRNKIEPSHAVPFRRPCVATNSSKARNEMLPLPHPPPGDTKVPAWHLYVLTVNSTCIYYQKTIDL